MVFGLKFGWFKKPGHLKEEKNMEKALEQEKKIVAKDVKKEKTIVGKAVDAGRGMVGGAVKTVGILLDSGVGVIQYGVEGIEKGASMIGSENCLRVFCHQSVELLKIIRSGARGIMNIGKWIEGSITTRDLMKQLLGFFKKAQVECCMIFPNLIFNQSTIGINNDKVHRGIIKIDTNHENAVNELGDKYVLEPINYDPSAYFIMHGYEVLKCSWHQRFLGEFWATWYNQVEVKKIKHEGIDTPEDNKIFKFMIEFNRTAICFDHPKEHEKKPGYISWQGLIEDKECKPLVIWKSGKLRKCYNEEKDLCILFPDCELKDLEVIAIPKDVKTAANIHEGTMIKFWMNFKLRNQEKH